MIMKRGLGGWYLIIALAWCCLPTITAASNNRFPKPRDESCHARNATRICNPDGILSPEEVTSLQHLIDIYESQPLTKHCRREKNPIPLQMAIYVESWLPPGQTSESMATDLHNEWGVGYNTACGGSGLLVYLAVESRQMYISRAKALQPVLTNPALHEVMNDMKPLLRNHLVASALQLAVVELTEFAQLERTVDCNRSAYCVGSTDWWIMGIFCSIPVGCISLACCCSCWEAKNKRKEEEKQRRLEYTLRCMEEDRKQVLQENRYKATSCPICLEDFLTASAPREESETTPLKEAQPPSGELVGSDGRPLKMLACGHVFDETCLLEWFQSTSNNSTETNTCPICRQPSTLAAPTHNNFGTRPAPFDMMRAYQEERRYRLERLQYMYPRYIEPSYVETWTQDDFEGDIHEDYQARRQVILEREAEERRRRQAESSSSGGGGGGGGGDFGGGSADGGGAGDSW